MMYAFYYTYKKIKIYWLTSKLKRVCPKVTVQGKGVRV